MPTLRVTKKIRFEMAHALYNYDGLCRNIHGHSYRMEVTLIGEVRNNNDHPRNGMVIDFGRLKNIVNKKIIDTFDHALVINHLTPKVNIEALKKTTERLIVVDFQPTSENLVLHFVKILQPELPANVSLFSLRLYETQDSFAEWFAGDND